MKTIQVRRTRYAGHCWRSKDELISDVLLWTLSQGRAKAERLARTYIQQLCADTGCGPEDLRRQWTIEKGGSRGSAISDVMMMITKIFWKFDLKAFSSFVLSMNKTFSKSYIILLLELTLDYIVLNYWLPDTTCFTYAEDHFYQNHQLAWQKTDWYKHHNTTEKMLWKKCVNIRCEEKALWSWPIWQSCYRETTVEEAKQCHRAPMDQGTQRLDNGAVNLCYGVGAFCQLQSQGFPPGEGQIQSDRLYHIITWSDLVGD